MRRIRAILLVSFAVVTIGATSVSAQQTQSCLEACQTQYNQCLSRCSGWTYLFCWNQCTNQLAWCEQVCYDTGVYPGPFHQGPLGALEWKVPPAAQRPSVTVASVVRVRKEIARQTSPAVLCLR